MKVTFNPDSVDAGDTLTVSATLRNQGMDSASGVEAEVILSVDESVGQSDIVLERFDVGTLAGNASQPFEADVTIPENLDQQVATWRVAVVIDPRNFISGERREDNNASFSPVALAVSGATGGCAEAL